MSKQIFYSKDATFTLTDTEFKDFIEKCAKNPRGKVWIERLGVFLSDMFIWAGEKPVVSDPNIIPIGHGDFAVKKFGDWYSQYSGAKLDMKIYGYLNEQKKDDVELLESENKKQLQ